MACTGNLRAFCSPTGRYWYKGLPQRFVKCLARTDSDDDTCTPKQEGPQTTEPTVHDQGDGWSQRAGQFAADVAVNPITYLVAALFSTAVVNVIGDGEVTVFLLAAFPVVGLTALSKSSVGKQVQKNLQGNLPELQAEAEAMQQAWAAAKKASPYFGESRPRLPGPLGSAPHLKGDLPGDYGFDPLALWQRASPKQRQWLVSAELLHARWAMLAVVGCLVPELLSLFGANVGEPVWWKVGAAKLQDGLSINYAGIEGFRIAGNQGLVVIAACQAALMGGPEYARSDGIDSLQPVGVFLPGSEDYPGGVPFDPLKYSMQPEEFLEQQVKEIKNGRLAMVSMLAFAVQAIVTQEGPVQNILDAFKLTL